MKPNLKILIIYNHPNPPEKTKSTIIHHLKALEYNKNNHITYYNGHEDVPGWTDIDNSTPKIRHDLLKTNFDAVILHYTFLGFRTIGLPFYKWKKLFDWIKQFHCPKIAIPQDEGNFSDVLDEWLHELKISIIFSIHYSKEGPLYPIMRNYAKIHHCLPGYIDEKVALQCKESIVAIAQRPNDIVYRAQKLPYWVGKAGALKYSIAKPIVEHAKKLNLKIDISTCYKDTIFGDRWLHFLASSKAVIGTQGGYSALNRRGELQAQVNALTKKNSTFKEVSTQMPVGWDSYNMLTITPRHFECIMTKTCQILIAGDYKGVIKPNKHYIPLKEDLSNLNEALKKLKDHDYLQGMVDSAYEDVYLNGAYNYRIFAEKIERALLASPQFSQKVRIMVDSKKEDDKSLASLERQLIAQKNQNIVLQYQFTEFQNKIIHFNTLTPYLEQVNRFGETLTKMVIAMKILLVMSVTIVLLLLSVVVLLTISLYVS